MTKPKENALSRGNELAQVLVLKKFGTPIEDEALGKAIVLLAWMTDEEFERISERAAKGWLE